MARQGFLVEIRVSRCNMIFQGSLIPTGYSTLTKRYRFSQLAHYQGHYRPHPGPA